MSTPIQKYADYRNLYYKLKNSVNTLGGNIARGTISGTKASELLLLNIEAQAKQKEAVTAYYKANKSQIDADPNLKAKFDGLQAELTELGTTLQLLATIKPTPVPGVSLDTASAVALLSTPSPAAPTVATTTENTEAATAAPAATDPGTPVNNNTNAGVTIARTQAIQREEASLDDKTDWRVRLSLSPNSNYLYNATDPGILSILKDTKGVLFPYTPTITVTYTASYEPITLTHSNYKNFQYTSSSVEGLSITGDFTAQDTYEANYLLAVIHFFRSVTKMFYGQDQNPKAGTPPPLCYLYGYGPYQFNAHPLVVTNFTMTLPDQVDYIRAGNPQLTAGVNRSQPGIISPNKPAPNTSDTSVGRTSEARLASGSAKINSTTGMTLSPGGILSSIPLNSGFNSSFVPGMSDNVTYVPTNMQISLQCSPIVSRYDISNKFSLRDYANGSLLYRKGSNSKLNGGIW
jgi:hypothetical protein